MEQEYKTAAQDRDFLIQKFMSEIKTGGELSLVFFNRTYSHTVLKKPKQNEFRVQADFGGMTERHQPENSVILSAEKILSHFSEEILYARVDGVLKDGEFILMEVELIEPELFFDYHDRARTEFAEAAIELLLK